MATEPVYLRALDAFASGEHGYATPGGVQRWTSARIPTDALVVTALEDIRAGQSGGFQEHPRPGEAAVHARPDGLYDVLRFTDDLKAAVWRAGLSFEAASELARNVAARKRRWLSAYDAPGVFERF
jgi:hypothetical protein